MCWWWSIRVFSISHTSSSHANCNTLSPVQWGLRNSSMRSTTVDQKNRKKKVHSFLEVEGVRLESICPNLTPTPAKHLLPFATIWDGSIAKQSKGTRVSHYIARVKRRGGMRLASVCQEKVPYGTFTRWQIGKVVLRTPNVLVMTIRNEFSKKKRILLGDTNPRLSVLVRPAL